MSIFFRKILVVLISSMWCIFFIPIIGYKGAPLSYLFAFSGPILFFSLPVTLTYGILVSYIIDYLTKNIDKYIFVKVFGYLFFGYLPGLLLSLSTDDNQFLIVGGLTVSMLFLIFDEVTKKKEGWNWIRSPLIWILVALPFCFISIFTLIIKIFNI